jgi:hypothetical protein
MIMHVLLSTDCAELLAHVGLSPAAGSVMLNGEWL